MRAVIKPIIIGFTALLLTACASGGKVDGPSSDAAKKNFDLGLAYVKQGQLEAAQEKFVRALSFDENYYAAYNALGAIYEEKKAYALAIKSYGRAAANKDYYLARSNYARLLCSNPPNGVESIKSALAIYKDISARVGGDKGAAALTGAGQCFTRVKQFPAAEMSFNQALEVSPAYLPALIELASVQQLQGKQAEARKSLQAYTSLAGATPRAQSIAGQLGLSL